MAGGLDIASRCCCMRVFVCVYDLCVPSAHVITCSCAWAALAQLEPADLYYIASKWRRTLQSCWQALASARFDPFVCQLHRCQLERKGFL